MEQTEEDQEEEEAFNCEINKLSIQLIIVFKKTAFKVDYFWFWSNSKYATGTAALRLLLRLKIYIFSGRRITYIFSKCSFFVLSFMIILYQKQQWRNSITDITLFQLSSILI